MHVSKGEARSWHGEGVPSSGLLQGVQLLLRGMMMIMMMMMMMMSL